MSAEAWVSPKRLADVLGFPLAAILSVAKEAGRYYQPYDLLLPGKKPRHIDNPTSDLRHLQGLIVRRILRQVAYPKFLFGSIRGRSTLDMARLHLGQPCVVAVDIRACFPSTRSQLVRSALVRHAGFGRETAALVTKLTTIHDSLPQGAPTSSYLLNLAMLDIHARLHADAVSRGLVYSVYVDDIVVSGKRPEPMVDRIAAVLRAHGFRLSHKKKRVMRGEEQEILGLSVGRSKPDADRKFYAHFETIIEDAKATGSITTKQKATLDGMLEYLQPLAPDQARVLRAVRDLVLESVVVVPAGEPPGSVCLPCKHRRRHRSAASDGRTAGVVVRPGTPSILDNH